MTGQTSQQQVTVGDIDVAYTEAGSGPPVVFVHGLAEDHHSWTRQQRDLAEYSTYAYALRGHGGTTPGESDGTLAQLGEDLIGFLENVSGPAVCVGFSLGGTIVLWAAARRPDLVPHPIVLGTSSVVGRAAAGFYAQRVSLAASGDKDGMYKAMREDTAAAITNSGVDVDAITRDRIAAIGDGAGYINAAQAMASLRETPLTPDLSDIPQHVDVIGADNDTFCPRKASDIILDALRDATYHEVSDAGHLMNVDAPEQITACLRAAIERKQ